MDDIATRDLEEKLREASCAGNEEMVVALLDKGVDVNAQHRINGWTALHWAAKRNNVKIAAHLLRSGADKTVKTMNGEKALQLTESSSIQTLLGGSPTGKCSDKSNLPITPNYLANPTFPYIVQSIPKAMDVESPLSHNTGQTDTRQQFTRGDKTVNSLTSTYHMIDETDLVLKVRVANAVETDFLEIELDKQRLTFDNLLSLMCKELEIKCELVIKVRKLPDTIIRKDKDVKRLHDFQELELVLANRAVSESSRNYTSVSPRHIDVVY